MHTRIVYHFQPGLALLINHTIIFNSCTWYENFSWVFLNRGEISARFAVVKFLYIIVILLLLVLPFSPMQDEISS